ncbi:hypothetical protein XENOCAPTIV_006430, partial [Xenoophorus captivus]
LYERMRADQRKFGKSTWAVAIERMERLQYAVSKETLQLMRAKEICLEQKKHGLKEENLQGGEDAMMRLDQLEALYYELQLQLYHIQAEVLRCEELLLTAQLQSLRRQMMGRNISFRNTYNRCDYQSPDAMKGEEEPASPPSPLRHEELCVLQQRTRQLEARRGRITAKKIYLKNKKVGESTQDDEAKSNISVSQERQRTLDRLRSLRQVKIYLSANVLLHLALHSTLTFLLLFHFTSCLLKLFKINILCALRCLSSSSSPMDEVLASLKRGSFHLRKAELRVLGPDPDDDSNNILAQIRQGVRLKKVRTRAEQQRRPKSFLHSADALTRSIHEALRRIKEASPESESEDEGLPCTDWEN